MKQRLVRVFISSTFRDMHGERDILVKRVFPEIRRRCRERAVEFVEVDLRWGITEEQAERGEVLPVCLAEIERCRPYFIGLLGERYGWVPPAINEELVELQPWLQEHKERSLTELEILHGVLRKPEAAKRAFFYLRDPAFIQTLPLERRGDFTAETPGSAEKLRWLKERIRGSGFPIHESYPTLEALGELVLQDLWQAIDQEFPQGSEPAPLDREAAEHEAFLGSRDKVYVGRDVYFDRLNRHVASTDPPLVLLGEAGCGKSALVANWVKRYRETHPDEFVFVHFIGSTPKSADYVSILSRLMGELKWHYRDLPELPESIEALRDALPNWLSMAATSGRMILILDGLNQLEDQDSAPDLVWLPESLPPEVRVVMSALPGRSLDAVNRRDWQTFVVESLRLDERVKVINDYLGQYRKRLSSERIERIASSAQTSNPLYLRVLLDELRIFGVHEELDHRIGHYLAAITVEDLYEKILERWESDYASGRPHLVRDVMCLLWAARRGISESELLDLLGSSTSPLPRAQWSPLFLAIEESLVSRSGLLGFVHGYLRQAVFNRYLVTQEQQRGAHLKLADYFYAKIRTPHKPYPAASGIAGFLGDCIRGKACLDIRTFNRHIRDYLRNSWHQYDEDRKDYRPPQQFRLIVWLLDRCHDYIRRYLSKTVGLEWTSGTVSPSNRRDTRGLEEGPWQLAQAHEWGRLYELLADVAGSVNLSV